MYEINNMENRGKIDVPSLVDLWEKSVRWSHFFLNNDDIDKIKTSLPVILLNVQNLYIANRVKTGELCAFMGMNFNKVEMLFVSPNFARMGIGKALLNQASIGREVVLVDVNEQNPNATAFYKKFGFKVMGRSEVDGDGNAFPLLHMSYQNHIQQGNM